MTNPAKVTISDIARVARVSPSTVSRVLRGTTAVSADKHRAVMHAVEALDYRPNIFAQSLASGQSMTIGVLTQTFGSPFYDAILQGILRGFQDTGYSPLFSDGRWDQAVELKALQTLIDRQIDALIVIGGRISEEKLKQLAQTTPLVIVGRYVPSLAPYCLTINNQTAARQAVAHLIEQGHRNIAHITGPIPEHETNDIGERHAGYRDALADAGIPYDPRLVTQGTLLQQSGLMAVQHLLMQGIPFSAIFCANDQMAFGARLALHRHGIRVPEDMSLIGFDDVSSAAYVIPPLTTIRQPSLELGEAAAQAVLDLLRGAKDVRQQFKAELVIRESVARVH